MAVPFEVAVADVHREHWPTLVAGLARWCGDLDRAEDAAADAVAAAVDRWPRDGVPDRPGAWLQTVARRRVLDRLRREKVADDHLAAVAAPPTVDAADLDDPFGAETGAEDLLRLVFTCCHPALGDAARIPLALRMLCGLTSAATARLMATSEATVAQRLTRAKRKIRTAGIALEIPPRSAWPERLGAVLTVVGLLFTEGHAATEGPELVRPELCDEALGLAALLRRLLPDEPEVLGLSALLLLTDARRAARLGTARDLVPLADQDRTAWRWDDVGEGLDHAARAVRLAGDRPGRWVLQAAIAALQVHPDADPDAVVALFDRLREVMPAPAVLVNRAAAVAVARGPAAGLEALDAATTAPEDHRALVLRAELHWQLGRVEEARALMRRAVDATRNDVERRHLDGRLATWTAP
ncbi:RNA polymerase sigma factor [Actinomycetospora sp. CA-101289]|uniref:RNA polymerase sigma factor n=1 Tax=Actinomycetospora sp. CA-101289 TaxID=3239893 RepID=UPI003D97A065